MSFLNKIKALGQKPDLALEQGALSLEKQSARGLGGAAASLTPESNAGTSAARFNMSTQAPSGSFDSSIISEAAPSGMADFSESRLAPRDSLMVPLGSGLPVIGGRPVADQRRILVACIVVGLVGLIAVTAYSLNSAINGSAQVGASGQALMQSQRLAKSVSQALVGSQAAFPEVTESVDVLARNVRGLKTGEGALAVAPAAVQESIDAVLPLVDRAEKNAKTIIGQQKVLTQVGESLKTINRQSADLLEIAETISSLKLQQNAAPAELSAAGPTGDVDPTHRQELQRIRDA